MKAYYNDNDAFVCAWLSNLMDAGLITPGKIDDRSIADLVPDDLEGYERVHFFAGIGGWDYALDLAGWEGPVWTGSCPCQPLSGAGLRKGHADERHLWPAFQSLIAVCRPPVVFGEQVASQDGREWLAGVRADLESMGYACGAADLPAAGVGAPHIRQRLWWVANAATAEVQPRFCEVQKGTGAESPNGLGDSEFDGRLADPDGRHPGTEGLQRGGQHGLQQEDGGTGGVAYAFSRENNEEQQESNTVERRRRPDGIGGRSVDFWSTAEWFQCSDGKARRIPADESGMPEPLLFPLVDAGTVRNRVGALRGSGNAIVPQVAAEFIAAHMETR